MSEQPEIGQALQTWFQSPAGQRVARCEREVLDPLLRRYVGARMLQIGSHGDDGQDVGPDMAMRWLLTPGTDPRAQLRGDPEHLPFTENSMQTILLLHALEFADAPHAVLREAVRVLSPEGHLLVVSFNPTSLLGLNRALLGSWRGQVPWSGHYYGGRRLRDWYRLLELEPICTRATAFGAPLGLRLPGPVNDRLAGFCQRRLPSLGGVRIMLLRKRIPRPHNPGGSKVASRLLPARPAAAASRETTAQSRDPDRNQGSAEIFARLR